MPELNDDLNLIKFRTGATETTDFENNIARFDFANEKLYYGGVAFSVSQDELQQAVAGKITATELLETLKSYALSANVPTISQIEAISDNQIAKANQNKTLTNYATTSELNAVYEVVTAKTTMAEVEAKGYITESAIADMATTGYVEQNYAKTTDIPTSNTAFTNEAGYITSADIPAIPKNTSDLTNDSGFITSSDVPTKVSDLTNDSGFVTGDDIPTKVSELTNDSGYITSSDVPTKVSELTNDSGFITSSDVPTKTSDLTNDSGFITSSDVPTKVSDLTNDSGFITSSDVPTKISELENDSKFITSGATVAQANKVSKSLTIKVNGVSKGAYNGASSKVYELTIPTSTTGLTNDSGFITSAVTVLDNFYDKDTVDSMLNDKMERKIVSSLPATGESNVIYMVAKTTAGTNDSYDEYMYLNSAWELIGNTKTDLTDYYKKTETSGKTEISTALAGKSDTGHKHTTGDVTGLGSMATQDTTSYSTATEVNTALTGKADASHTHTTGDVTGLGSMATQAKTSYSTKTEVSNALAGKSPTGHTHTTGDVTGLGSMATQNTSSYSTATQVNTALAGKSDTNHTHDFSSSYLPLSGGTVTGSTTFSGSSFGTELIIKRGSTTDGSAIQFRGTTDVYGYLGFNSSNEPMWWNASKTAYKLVHEGNSAHTHSYLPLSGGTMTGDLLFSDAQCIKWTGSAYNQRLLITDDSVAGTSVFKFQQSSDSGANWTDLFDIRDNGVVKATSFSGNLSGTSTNANYLNDLGWHTEPASTSSSAGTKFAGTICGETMGMFLTESYSDANTPSTYGNLLTVKGTGGGQLLMGWNGNYTTGGLWYRSHRDNMESGGWTAWDRLVTSSNSAHTHSYLPLSGGTVTGNTTFSGSSYKNLKVLRGDATKGAFIEYKNTTGVLGYIGVGGSASDYPNQPMFGESGGSTWHKLLYDGNSAHTHSEYLPLSGGTMTGALNATSGAGSQGNVVISNAIENMTASSATQVAKAMGSFVGSWISGSTWQTLVNVRHRNGTTDGKNYGFYIRSCMTDNSDSLWYNKEYNGTWSGERKILDSANFNSVISGTFVNRSGDTMTGSLHINPTGSSYNQGLRVNLSDDGWALVNIGGAKNSTTGTQDGSWLIGRRGATGSTFGVVGDLCIENNGSTGAGVTITKSGSIYSHGNVVTKGDVSIGRGASGGALTGGVTQRYNSTTKSLEFIFN